MEHSCSLGRDQARPIESGTGAVASATSHDIWYGRIYPSDGRAPFNAYFYGHTAVTYALYGPFRNRADAELILDDLLSRARVGYVGPTMMSWIYANLDEPDLAFEWLRKACSEHDCTLAFGIRVPIYDRISGDSRFQELVRCLRLG